MTKSIVQKDLAGHTKQLRGPNVGRAHHSIIAPEQHNRLQRNVAAIKSFWQRCVWFDQIDLNLRPPMPETNALPLDQLAA